MKDPVEQKAPEDERRRSFAGMVDRKTERRLRAVRQRDRGIWFGLGMMGLVGWTVAIPALIGLAVGVWLDKTTSSRYSWTLMGLFAGMAVGCLMAWRWVKRESSEDSDE